MRTNFLPGIDDIKQKIVINRPLVKINNKLPSLVDGMLKFKRIIRAINIPVKKIGAISCNIHFQ